MKSATLFLCFLATLSSLVFALPLQRRQFDKLQASQAQLDKDVATFTNLVFTLLHIEIDIDIQLGPILKKIIGDYQDCNSALQKNGKLSDSQAQDAINQYRSSSSTFTNGLNQLAAAQQNNPPLGAVAVRLQADGAVVSVNMQTFGGQLGQQSPNENNGANQKEVNTITNGLQDAIERAFD